MATFQDLVEIQSQPLDLAKYINHVRHPRAGAISTFSGTTRDHFHGRQVIQLEYEAYTPMAVRQMLSIVTSARSRWSLVGVAVAHRIGTVPISEDSVFIAVSSVHRSDAILACHFIIDEIKASVPIWKKEVYSDGQVWKENSEFFGHGDGGQLIRKPCCGGERRLDKEKQHADMLNGHGSSVEVKHKVEKSEDMQHKYQNSVDIHHSHESSVGKHHGDGNHVDLKHHRELGADFHQTHGHGNSSDVKCDANGRKNIDHTHSYGNSVECRPVLEQKIYNVHGNKDIGHTHSYGNSVVCRPVLEQKIHTDHGNSVDAKCDTKGVQDIDHIDSYMNSVECRPALEQKIHNGNENAVEHKANGELSVHHGHGNSEELNLDRLGKLYSFQNHEN